MNAKLHYLTQKMVRAIADREKEMISADILILDKKPEHYDFGLHLFCSLPRPGDRVKLTNADGTGYTDLEVLYIAHFAVLDLDDTSAKPSLAIYARDWLGSN